MAVVYSTDFDAETTGAVPTGWTNATGSATVTTTSPVKGTKSYSTGSTTDGFLSVYGGQSSLTNQDVTLVTRVEDAGGGNLTSAQPFVRSNSGATQHYLALCSGANIVLFRNNSGYTQIASAAHGLSLPVNTLFRIRIQATGTTIRARAWIDGSGEPGTWMVSVTQANYSAGSQGIRWGSTGTGLSRADEFAVDDMASPATATTLTGPTSGTAGVSSTNFTVGANGAITGTVTVTPSDGGGGGSFTPTSVAISSGTPTATFTYTAGSAGVKTISTTNNGGLTNPSSISYTAAAAPTTYPVTDANIFWSPYNWYSDGGGSMQANNVKASSTFAWSGMRGAYLKFKATVAAGGSITLNINTSTLSAIAAGGCPQLAWSVNGAAIQSQLLASGATTVSIGTGLGAGTYEVFIYFRGVHITQDGGTAQNYTAINNRVQITGIVISAGGTLSPATIKSKRAIIYGDSITEGDLSNGGPRSASSQDALLTYSWLLAAALDAEVGIVAFYGQTWSWFNSTWTNHASGFSRLTGGLLTPAPDHVVINYGENDGNPGPASATVAATLSAVSAAAPTAKISLVVPFSGRARTNLTAAALPSNAVRVDLARYEMAPGATQWSFDGVHPDQRGHANLAGLLAYAINQATAGTSRTVTLTLTTDGTAPAANLTALRWRFFDSPQGNGSAAPVSTGSGATTNASGVFSVTVNTTLPSGGVGWLTVTDSDGTVAQNPMKGFAGPVTVT